MTSEEIEALALYIRNSLPNIFGPVTAPGLTVQEIWTRGQPTRVQVVLQHGERKAIVDVEMVGPEGEWRRDMLDDVCSALRRLDGLHHLVEPYGDTPATRIVSALLDDVTDRRGWRSTWDTFSVATRGEIVRRWIAIVTRELNP